MMKFLRRAVLALVVLGLTACDGELSLTAPGPSDAGEAAGADRPAAGAETGEAEAPFAFQRTSVREDAPKPTLCLHFTRPLDPAIDYEPFIAIDRPVALTAEGQALCIEGLDYGEEARLTLRAGLPGADGERLEADETVTLTFAARPPVVRFAGNGVVLPRSDARGLGIVTVNVDAVTVRVSRVTDRALVFRDVTEGSSEDEGGYGWSFYEEEPGELGAPVFEGILETPGAENAATTTLMPLEESLGALETGAYYVEIADAAAVARGERNPARAARWIIVTDLAMTAYRGQDGLDVTVRSLQTGEPVRRADVRLLARSNEILMETRTGLDGRVRFDAPLLAGEAGNRPRLLTVEGPAGDFAILDLDRAPLDLSSQPVGGMPARKALEAFVYLDRGIYRPGETVHASALLRDDQGYAADGRPGALVLYRPNGLEQARHRFGKTGRAGSVIHAFDLPDAASRGIWRIAMELDGAGEVGSALLNVEDFVPQRMKLELSADTETAMAAGESRPVTARLRFLYGAPGAGLRISGTARIEEDPTPFEGFEDFRFGLADDPFRPRIIDLSTVVTDGEGVAAMPLEAEGIGSGAPGALRLRAVLRAEEPGGRAVQDDLIVPYRPREQYVGLRTRFEGSAEKDEPVLFDAAALTRDGAPVEAQLGWRLVRRDYEYDWFQDSRGVWRWNRSERIVTIAEGLVRTGTDGLARIEGPALPWGDYQMVVTSRGEARASASFWVGYGGRSADGTPAPDSVRVLTPDDRPAIGEEVRIAIQAPYPGRAEVAVATGSILSLDHIDVPEGGTEITLPVTRDWGAGAYVLVSVYTEREPGVMPVPRRAIGAAYVAVDNADRIHQVGIEAPDLARPGRPVTVTLRTGSGPQGEEAYATLAAIDEGILLLTKHASPDPEDAIFGKARLGVEVYDDYGRILDPDTGETGAFRSGGDAIGGAGLTVVPTKTVALFEGPLSIGRDGTAAVELDLPDFNGELRLMAVVWSKSGVGAASAPLTVRDEVPAELILPRFLAPGDEALATLTIDNVEGPEGTYRARVTHQKTATPVLSGIGDPEAVELGVGERRELPVPVSAGATGLTEINLAVSGPSGFAVERSYPLEVRGAFLPETRVIRRALAPGESFVPGAAVFDGFEKGSGELFVSAAATPIDRGPLAASLTAYPYSCTEQLVSQATPLLLDPRRTAEGTARLNRVIETILERQGPDGAFGLWRVGDRGASPWLGAYTADFLARARAAGLPVPQASLDLAFGALQPISQGEPWRAYGYNSRLSSPRYTTDTDDRLKDRSAAYALYVLARAGQADRSRLRYLHDARLREIESPLARAHIAAGLAAIGDENRSRNAFEAAVEALGYENPGDWYQSPIRDAAGVLALLAETGRDGRANQLLTSLGGTIPEPARLNTQEKAFLVRAADAFAGGGAEAVLRHQGEDISERRLTASDGIDTAFLNDSDRTAYVTAFARGVPAEPPAATESGFTVGKQLLSPSGESVDPGAIARGDRLVISLTITPENEAEAQIVVTDLLPAGFEIETVLRPEDTAENGPYAFIGQLSRPDIAEARDDRFVGSLVIRGTETRRLAYMVRAVTPGDFVAPGAVVEDMYRPDRFARSGAGRVRIAP